MKNADKSIGSSETRSITLSQAHIYPLDAYLHNLFTEITGIFGDTRADGSTDTVIKTMEIKLIQTRSSRNNRSISDFFPQKN